MATRDLRAADRLALFFVGYGFAVGCVVALALAFQLDPLRSIIPHAFVPTLDQILRQGEEQRLLVHALYSGYGLLMMSLGFLLHRKVLAEAVQIGDPRWSGYSRSTRNST